MPTQNTQNRDKSARQQSKENAGQDVRELLDGIDLSDLGLDKRKFSEVPEGAATGLATKGDAQADLQTGRGPIISRSTPVQPLEEAYAAAMDSGNAFELGKAPNLDEAKAAQIGNDLKMKLEAFLEKYEITGGESLPRPPAPKMPTKDEI